MRKENIYDNDNKAIKWSLANFIIRINLIF
jgi:hypothetical protein